MALSVRRLISNSAGGAPQVVYNAAGTPLAIELGSTIDDLSEAVDGRSGKYRLDFTDERGKRLTGATVEAAYVVVGDVGALADFAGGGEGLSPALAIVAQMARAQGEAMTTIVQQISAQLAPLMQAATKLVEAVDSAGVSKRPPPQVVEAEVVEMTTLPQPEPSTWRPVVETVLPQVPVLLQALMAFVATRTGTPVIPTPPGVPA